MLKHGNNYLEAYHMVRTLPPEVRRHFIGVANEIAAIGDRLQIPPRQMAVAVATILGSLVFAETEGDVNANQRIDDFIEFAVDAMHVAVVDMRIENGWKPLPEKVDDQTGV